MTEHWLHPIIPNSIPTSILARADELVRKTAFLSGMVAPETAACLSERLKGANAHYSNMIDGNPSEPETLVRAFILEHHQSAFGGIPEHRRRIVAVLCQHYQLLHERTPREANGAFARALTIEHFAQLGLQPHLWSLSRGLGRRLDEYLSATAMNGPLGNDGLEGTQERTAGEQLAFIDFMLDVCHEEVDYMSAALNRRKLRESVTNAFNTNSRFAETGIKAEIAPAFLALLIQGALPRSEFKTFTGLQPDIAKDQLNRLIDVGVVGSSPSDLLTIEVALPDWFVKELLPDLPFSRKVERVALS